MGFATSGPAPQRPDLEAESRSVIARTPRRPHEFSRAPDATGRSTDRQQTVDCTVELAVFLLLLPNLMRFVTDAATLSDRFSNTRLETVPWT